MNEARLMEAERLAARPYHVRIYPDVTTDGEPWFYAVIPDLPGCNSHGESVEEARESVESAKVGFIYFLLEDNLPVPEPRLLGAPIVIDVNEYVSAIAGSPQPEVLQVF